MEITLEELDTLSIESEKKNQRIRELEECLSLMYDLGDNDLCTGREIQKEYPDLFNRAKQLLNQKQERRVKG